jgi:hypothetical protein
VVTPEWLVIPEWLRRLSLALLALVFSACLYALFDLLANERLSRAGHLDIVPYLGALAAALLTAPAPLRRFEARALPRFLWLPALTSVLLTLLASRLFQPSWLGTNNFHAELRLAAYHHSLLALGLVALLGVAVSLPLLLIRRVNAQLEWQVLAAGVGGLGVVLCIGGDTLSRAAGNLLLALPFLIVGAMSYLVDVGPQRDVELEPAAPRPGHLNRPLTLCLACLAAALVLGFPYQGLGGALLRWESRGASEEVEDALRGCGELLDAHRARQGVCPDSLSDLTGVAPELACGVGHGYVFRYGARKRRWVLAADPQLEGVRTGLHYRLTDDGVLESGPKPWPLSFEIE